MNLHMGGKKKIRKKEHPLFLGALLLDILDCHPSTPKVTFKKTLSQETDHNQWSEYGLGGSQWKVMVSPSRI